MLHIKGSGRFDQDVVGEQHYQDALIRIAGPYTKEGRRIRCQAVLFLQPDNPHDRNAIRVEIEGATVGYIHREQAPTLRRQLQMLGIGNGQRVTVDAAIGGGRIGTRYGVYLDFDVPDAPQDYAPPSSAAPPVIKPTVHGAKKPVSWEEEKATRYVPPPPMKNNGVPGWAWSLLIVLGLVGGCVALSTLGR